MRKIITFLSFIFLLVTLTACIVEIETFTVTFQSNGGTAVQSLTDVGSDSTIAEPSPPTKEGYLFEGWYKEVALTNPWNFATDKVTADITLYAKWGVNQQAVVDDVYDWLNLGNLSELTNISPRIIMPTTREGVGISWHIDKPEYILANGMISQPDHETGAQTVTLTATLTLGAVVRTKVFVATVLALPSPDQMPPLLYETFEDYEDGNILTQAGIWMPVSGKTGTSLFTVVSSITGMTIPEDSKALKIEALTELQIETPLVHTYDIVVIEVDLMRHATDSSPINIQTSASSPVIGFGLTGTGIFYRIDNGPQHATTIPADTWYRVRLEADLVNKTIEVFYYEDGQLIAVTPGKVSFTGTTTLSSIFIRSGSSTTTELRNPAYLTNMNINRIESLPRPEEDVKLGEVTGIQDMISIEQGTPFVADEPVVHNFFGSQSVLVKDTHYSLVVDHDIDIEVPDHYEVTYTITNLQDPLDVKTFTQDVTVYAVAAPNVILTANTTVVGYLTGQSTATITVVQPEGTLYYIMNDDPTATAEAIKAGESVAITETTVVLEDLDVEHAYIHLIVDLNGDSNIISHLFVTETVTMVTTAQEFYNMASSTSQDSFVIANDIDFTGFEWIQSGTGNNFRGKVYGNDKTLSNITITTTGTGVYGGIFQRINGAVIRDLVIDNANVTIGTGRGGILVGRIENSAALIENIVILNSAISGTDSNGVGGLVGHVSNQLTIRNITIADTTITSSERNAGGVIGRVEGVTLYAEDIFVTGVHVGTTYTAGLDNGIGAFLGYVINNDASRAHVNRLVIVNTTLDARNAGAIYGYVRRETSGAGLGFATDVYLDVTFVNTERSGIIGRVNSENEFVDPATIFGILTDVVSHSSAQPLVNDLTGVTVDDAWWTTNLESIAISDLWVIIGGAARLALYELTQLPDYELTLVYNIAVDAESIFVREGQPVVHEAPAVPGYNFVGWYLDEDLTLALPIDYVVTGEDTIYGKYETVPASTVTFDANMVGVTVDPQQVNYGELATEPAVTDTMHEDVLKEVIGWTLDGEPFAFTTPITSDITLVAVWDVVSYTVTFTGVDSVEVEYGQTVSQPADPGHPVFTTAAFVQWNLSGLAFDFATPVTANLTLSPVWQQPYEITTVDQFYHMATSSTSDSFILMNDLDFAEFNWTYVNASFGGVFDGQNFTVSNISMTGIIGDVRVGIFARANGATIENLVINNITIETEARAGALVGRVENNETYIENIVVKNSSITGGNANGVGGLLGQVSTPAFISKIVVVNTTVTATGQKNVGGLIGRIDSNGNVTLDDVFVSGVTVTSTATGNDLGVGAVIGYVANNDNAHISATKIVVIQTTLSGNVGGAFVGYLRYPGTGDLSHAYFDVTFANNTRTGLIGYFRDQVDPFDQSAIFATVSNHTFHTQGLEFTNLVTDPLTESWWETNLEVIFNSLWFVVLSDGTITALPLVD